LNTNEHFFENELELGDLYWTATSLHVYERDFKLLDDLISTGKYEG
jgi:thymidylate synthase